MKSISLFIVATCIGNISFGQLTVDLDFSNANQTTAYLKKTNPSAEETAQMLSSDGLKIIIRKIRSNDSIAEIALNKAAAGIKVPGKEKDFQFDFIKAHLQEMEDFMAKIKKNKAVILDSIQSLTKYLPAGKSKHIRVCFLMGGYSSGFTMGDDSVFYIGTHQYMYDVSGIINTCQHELFHNIQSLLYDRNAVMKKLEANNELPSLYAYYLFNNIFIEGSADYIADIDKMDTASAYIKSQVEHAGVNNYRMADNFYLIETIVMSAYNNPGKTDADAAYRVLFDWSWNNPGYSAGKLMCKALVKAYGANIIKKYLSEGPVVFFKDYMQLAKADPSTYPYNFSPEFEQMLDTVNTKIAASQKTEVK